LRARLKTGRNNSIRLQSVRLSATKAMVRKFQLKTRAAEHAYLGRLHFPATVYTRQVANWMTPEGINLSPSESTWSWLKALAAKRRLFLGMR
jgi:hypothetical protein